MRASDSGEWQLLRCPRPTCTTTMLRARRDPHGRDHWWVGRLDYSGTWRMAADKPRCPLCGWELEGEGGVREREAKRKTESP